MFRLFPLLSLFTFVACDGERDLSCAEDLTTSLEGPDTLAVGESGALVLKANRGPLVLMRVSVDGPAELAVRTSSNPATYKPVPSDGSFSDVARNSRDYELTCTGNGPVVVAIWAQTGFECEPVLADLVVSCGTGDPTIPTTPTEPQIDCQDEILLDQRTTLTELLGIDGCDDTQTATDQSDPVHPDGQTTSQPVDHTGIIAWMAGVGDLDQTTVDALFNDPSAPFACSSDPAQLTVCAMNAPADFPPGPVKVFAMSMADAIPLDAPADFYQYGVAFDSDGEVANNRPSQPPYDYSFTDGTDLSYVAWYDPGYAASPWFLSIIDWTTGVLVDRSWSSARMVFRGNTVVMIAPATDFAIPYPGTRFFSWFHPGDWGYAGVWSADVEPPVSQGLHDWQP